MGPAFLKHQVELPIFDYYVNDTSRFGERIMKRLLSKMIYFALFVFQDLNVCICSKGMGKHYF